MNTFFADMVARGLGGVALVTSDAHTGLEDAIAAHLPGAALAEVSHRLRREPNSVTPKSMWPAVTAMPHSVYDQLDAPAVAAQFELLTDYADDTLPTVAEYVAAAGDDILAFTTFPEGLWQQIWSNNPTSV